jgi:hypothetical protein
VELVMWLFALSACVDPLPDDTPYVDGLRVLAARASPPEVLAGETTTLSALVFDRDGPVSGEPLDWAFCTATRPLAELGPVSTRCLDPDDDALLALDAGQEVSGAVPADACSRFGPNPPPPAEGQPAGRPSDADVTGGYYQPALAFDDAGVTLAPVRVRCGLANVAQEASVAWNLAYVSNVAPEAARFDAGGDDLLAGTATVGEGEVTLTVGWTACESGEACTGAEEYVVWDEPTDALLDRREAISAAWYTTGGTWDVARNGRAGDDDAREVTNVLTLPADAGTVHVAVVLRDERGGVSWVTGALER